MLRATALVGLAVALMVGGTVWGGWWALPVLGLLWGAVGYRGRYPGLLAALAGMVAWTGLLIFAASRAEIDQVATLTGGVLGVPTAATYGITVAFAALLAGSAGTVGRALRSVVGPDPGARPAST